MSLLLLLFAFVSFATCHFDFEEVLPKSAVDRIISKHFERIKQDPLFKTLDDETVKSIPGRKPITLSHKCIHDELVERQKKENPDFLATVAEMEAPEGSNLKRKAASYQPIRTVVNTDLLQGQTDNNACYQVGEKVTVDGGGTHTCSKQDILSSTLQTFFRDNVIPAIREIFQELLLVIPLENGLRLPNGQCIPGYNIPQQYQQNGFDGDFLFFAAGRPSSSDNTVAYASACLTLNTNGRPVAGFINFCPLQFQQFLTSFTKFEFSGSIKVGVHELTHALGFSSSMFPTYINSNGNTYNPTVTKAISGTSAAGNPYSVNIHGFNGPNVLKFARDYYQCDSLEYVELENAGGSGTAGSHWEMRVAGNEYMCGYINPSMPISGLTLSALEDSGWYQVDKTKSEYFAFGKDQGCGFTQKRCEQSWTGKPGYFCSGQIQGCTADRRALGICRVGTYSGDLPAYYQHFSDPQVGGLLSPADYCPFTEGYSNGYCADTSQSSSGEYFGDDSLCWEYASGEGTISPTSPTMACWQHKCESDSLKVKIGGSWYTCPKNGGTMTVGALQGGVVNCPSTSVVCRPVAGYSYDGGFSESSSGKIEIISSFIVLVVLLLIV